MPGTYNGRSPGISDHRPGGWGHQPPVALSAAPGILPGCGARPAPSHQSLNRHTMLGRQHLHRSSELVAEVPADHHLARPVLPARLGGLIPSPTTVGSGTGAAAAHALPRFGFSKVGLEASAIRSGDGGHKATTRLVVKPDWPASATTSAAVPGQWRTTLSQNACPNRGAVASTSRKQ